MQLIDTVKWLWDPRSKEQKRYDEDPLQRHTQTLHIYIKDMPEPFVRVLDYEDTRYGSLGVFRVDLDCRVNEWLVNRGTNGVKIDQVWYAPDQIVRIELGEQTVEVIND
jgi:hypothetical protein